MKVTETLTKFSCDVCGAENIEPQEVMHFTTFGYRPVEAIGVKVCVRAFGTMTEHVCAKCAKTAILAAAKELAR